jgi:RNA polymerase sigma-70 factor (sigma-E family)
VASDELPQVGFLGRADGESCNLRRLPGVSWIVDSVTPQRAEMTVQRPEEEFDVFYDRVRSRLLGLAMLLTGDRELAQDLAQEALLRTWRTWSRVRRYEDPEGWTRRVLHNLAVSELRRRRPRLAVEERAGGEPSPDAMALSAALAALPPRVRRVLVLYYYADMPVGAIARELRVPEGTVKSWLSRGRAAMNTLLRDDAGGHEEGGPER